MSKVTRLDYCQFLLVSQTNYTLTYFAEHSPGFSHDAVKRYLEEDKLTARIVGENVRGQVVRSGQGYLAFDDTVLDHDSSFKIELVRRQYSGNAHDIIKGMGVVTCVYINPETDQFWMIDYRIYDPERDGKVYYCPLKDNRQVDETGGERGYQRVDSLTWTETEVQHGKLLHVKDFPKAHQVKLFRLVLSTKRTDFIATNDFAQDSTQDTQEVCALRWKIEQFHREGKQTTGLEGCQCRLARIQRNHIACAILVWVRLKQVAQETASTIYQLKQGLLDDYMRFQLRSPAIQMQLA